MNKNSTILDNTLTLLEKIEPVISNELKQKIIRKKGWRTRFAPSPSGFLHIGHAFAALIGWQIANQNPEKFLLRIDDLDFTRCSQKYVNQLISDLKWLDINWTANEMYQSQRLSHYSRALQYLFDKDLIYPCYLSRSELTEFLSPPIEGISKQPNTRQSLSSQVIAKRQQKGIKPVLRLDMKKAIQKVGAISWVNIDGTSLKAEPEKFGDIILGRRDITASYHLSVVLDDAQSNIEVVTRGEDLRHSTDIHCLLQNLLHLPSPIYFHHPLIFGEDGNKLSKRHKSPSLVDLRNYKKTLKKILNTKILNNN